VTRDRILLGAGVLCVGLAVVVVLVARDAGRWQSAIQAGDVPASRASASPEVDETLPFSPARRLLGLGDDVAFRRALGLFRAAYPRTGQFQRSTDGARARIGAETALTETIRTERDRRRASTASNLLGILALVDSATAPAGNGAVDRGVLAFQDAIRLDPSNADAKTNLELLFQRSASTSSVRGRERLQRSAHASASESEAGHGY
jgi:hypothetical protein